MFLLLSCPLQVFLQQSFQMKPQFPLLQAQDMRLLRWPYNGTSCLEESKTIYFLCAEKIRSGFSGLGSFATHGGCSMWSRHPGRFPWRADPAHTEQLSPAEEVHALL